MHPAGFKPNLEREKDHSFSSQFDFMSEAQEHNPYFNRKLFIDLDGSIKNAPEAEESFGSVYKIEGSNDLREIVNSDGFQRYWKAPKSQSDVCCTCEFRMVCLDNRPPKPRANGQWYFEEECSYNPFLCKWKGEEGYQNLQDCGVRSDANEYSVKPEQLADINASLWA